MIFLHLHGVDDRVMVTRGAGCALARTFFIVVSPWAAGRGPPQGERFQVSSSKIVAPSHRPRDGIVPGCQADVPALRMGGGRRGSQSDYPENGSSQSDGGIRKVYQIDVGSRL